MGRNPEDIRARLAGQLPGEQALEAVIPLTAGHSNETYLLAGPNWVLRLAPDADALMDGLDPIAQAHVYRELGSIADAPPVPGIVLIREDAELLGSPFYIMERVAGEVLSDYEPQPWFTDASPEFRGEMTRQYVETFAGLAHLPPLRSFGAAVRPIEEAGRWRALAQAARQPELIAAFDRLMARAPGESGAPCPVHGDAKLANMLWHDGRLLAVLDWEIGFNGDPLFDLGYMLMFFASAEHPPMRGFEAPGMWDRERAIAAWEAVSGRSAEALPWYEAAAIGKSAAIMAHGHYLAVEGLSPDPRLLTWKPFADAATASFAALVDRAGP